MIFQVILFTMLSSCYAKIGREKSVLEFNSSRRLQNCGALNMFQDYQVTAISAIGPAMEGQKVTVTSKVAPSVNAACTMMLCSESEPCCNTCTSDLRMGDIVLDAPDLTCKGTNCDWMDNCTYNQGDVITVYGVVSGSSINVENHCLVGSQVGFMSSCGDPRQGYTEINVESITADMVGQTVMVTSSVENPNIAACTRMFCLEENLCCNSCNGNSMFGNVYLVDSGGHKLGCQGTDCDWEDNCIYSSADVVTVYGTVGGNGDVINIDDHCKVA